MKTIIAALVAPLAALIGLLLMQRLEAALLSPSTAPGPPPEPSDLAEPEPDHLDDRAGVEGPDAPAPRPSPAGDAAPAVLAPAHGRRVQTGRPSTHDLRRRRHRLRQERPSHGLGRTSSWGYARPGLRLRGAAPLPPNRRT